MKPLDGVTVLDFTQAYSGAYCTLNLADYGARVIKIERVGTGDQAREWTPVRPTGESAYFALYNRNKEGVAINMRDPRGVEIVKRIAKKADIAVNNFKPGTLEKLGLGYEELKKVNPNIIFASVSGYGNNGPMSKLAAYDNIIEATSGVMNQSGFPDRQPVRSGVSMGDSYTGLSATVGIAAAYYYKLKHNEGQVVDVAMQDALFAGLEDTILEYFANNRLLARQGNSRTHMFSPYDVAKCKDGWVAFSAITDEGFLEYCEDMGRMDLANDERFKTNELRCENNDQLISEMKKDLINVAFDDIDKIFRQKKFAISPVYNAGETIEAKNINDRNMVVEIDDHYVGKFRSVGLPIKFEKTPGEILKGSPLLGEFTVSVLKDFDYTDEEIEYLLKEGVVEQYKKEV